MGIGVKVRVWGKYALFSRPSSPGRKYGQKPAKAFSGYSVYKP